MREQPFDWRPYIIEFHRQAPKLMRARAFVLGGVLQLRLVGDGMTLAQAVVIDGGWVRAEAGVVTWRYRREQMLPSLISACIQHCVVEMTRDFHAVERLGILAMTRKPQEPRRIDCEKGILFGVDLAYDKPVVVAVPAICNPPVVAVPDDPIWAWRYSRNNISFKSKDLR